MSLINFFKNSFFLQNLAARILSLIPPLIEHNIGKYMAIKKAFYLTGLEQLHGDYLEFGVFTGSSFVFATRIHRQLGILGNITTRFYGFDSFAGFGNKSAEDQHPFYADDTFRVNADRVIKNIQNQTRGSEIVITKGYFEQTLAGKTALDMGVKKARIIFIDCDLKDPSQLALDFVFPTLQEGTVLIMDDFFSYKGNSTLGVAGAFQAFNDRHKSLSWRQLYTYGYGGAAFICSSV